MYHVPQGEERAPGKLSKLRWGRYFTVEQGRLEELTLSQGQTITRTVTANGLEELKASITWTDVPGQVADNNLNSSTPILVNDLDIRVTRNSDTYLPWRLDFFNPTGDAVKADNNVDNVERVDVENTVANAEYTVTTSSYPRVFTVQRNTSQ